MKDLLPIGTVVLLKGGIKRIMIIGFCVTMRDDNSKIFDYCGCVYPEGIISSDKNLLFDHENIDKIFYQGYVDDEYNEFKLKLDEARTQIFNKQEPELPNLAKTDESSGDNLETL